MRKIMIVAAAAAALTAVPAAAQERGGEARLEIRGGVAWAGGTDKPFAGVALGYDFDLGTSAFAGVEVSGDKVLANGANVLGGVSGRAGVRVGERTKLYGLGGYGFTKGEDAAFAGAGVQFGFAERAYLKAEYRQTFNDGKNVNFAGGGIGVTF